MGSTSVAPPVRASRARAEGGMPLVSCRWLVRQSRSVWRKLARGERDSRAKPCYDGCRGVRGGAWTSGDSVDVAFRAEGQSTWWKRRTKRGARVRLGTTTRWNVTARAVDVNQQDLLDRLVENALDFLSQSIRELLDDQPKYSVIHFHAAVELFLKARLMAEHWSLVVARNKEPDWDRFVAGDFVSVSLEEAAKKLDKVVQSGLGKQALRTFIGVTKHRNKMVHFFHEGVTADENDQLRREVAKEQLTAWYLLHKLLTSKWSEVFSPWSRELGELDAELRKLQDFLKVVHDQLAPEINKRSEAGAIFSVCPSCGFESQEHEDCVGVVYEAECLVCGFADRCLTIECPECGEVVRFANEAFGECRNCGQPLEPQHVAKVLVDEGATYVAMTDGDDLVGFGQLQRLRWLSHSRPTQ